VIWPNLSKAQKKEINHLLNDTYNSVVFLDEQLQPGIAEISEDRYYNSIFLNFETHPRALARTRVYESIGFGDYGETHYSEYYFLFFKWIKISREMTSQS
jgi:hypothetical protein